MDIKKANEGFLMTTWLIELDMKLSGPKDVIGHILARRQVLCSRHFLHTLWIVQITLTLVVLGREKLNKI
ncbi:hypothetical protein NQ318_020730 [Aromia moschata]|uniref:Uncharacterized protein n=1 Tax=Aromia moschata TaxID=1265417 RepID=A0AAV8YXV6_9CUCU|nr:hypothetical protein NQ318_020730 [Aromia moschata]